MVVQKQQEELTTEFLAKECEEITGQVMSLNIDKGKLVANIQFEKAKDELNLFIKQQRGSNNEIVAELQELKYWISWFKNNQKGNLIQATQRLVDELSTAQFKQKKAKQAWQEM